MAIDSARTEPRSRRAILAGAIGGVAALIGGRFASPDRAKGAAGDPLIIGNTSNNAGTSNTTLTTSSTGTGLLVTQNGAGTALRGSAVGPGSIAGFFTAQHGTGISGVTGAAGSYGVFAQSNGAAGTAGALRASGNNNHGVVATTSNASKAAVSGINQATGPNGVGVRGQSSSTVDGIGVYGTAAGGSATGVLGENTEGNGVVGYSVDSAGVLGVSTDGEAVRGLSTNSNGVSGTANDGQGVVGTSTNGYGVLGTSTNSNGVTGLSSGSVTSGVYGENVDGYGVAGRASGDGIGVYGQASGSGSGVYGLAGTGSGVKGTGSYGVHGTSSDGTGVVGESTTGWGVYGWGGGLAAYFAGDVAVFGTLSKGGGSFTIDHPLDPAHKVLQHSFVESPDMMNVYNGTVTTDAKGDAVVRLPAYFGALNRDFRYQLTVIGPEFAQAVVSREIADRRFSIRTDHPNVKVSWQVTGIRQDAFANAHRLVVEADKPKDQSGRYLYPTEHGQPESKGVDYEKRRAMKGTP